MTAAPSRFSTVAVCLLLLATAVSIRPPAASAQDSDGPPRRITLAAAHDMMARQSPVLRLARTGAAEMEALARQAGAYPNPTLSVTHEPSWRNGTGYDESYFNVSQRIEWMGRRRARVDEAQHLAQASRASYDADSLRVAYLVGLAFHEAAAAEHRAEVLAHVAASFRRADSTTAARVAEGEASRFSLRRLRVERAGYELRLARAQMAVRESRRRLTELLMPENGGPLMAPDGVDWRVPTAEPVTVYRDAALAGRPELTALRREADAAEAGLLGARLEARPDPTVTAGYKRQSDGFDGLFLGMSVPLPVLDRNRGGIEAARMRLQASETRIMALEYRIELDVREAYHRFQATSRGYDLISGDLLGEAEALLTAAQVGYREDEMTLLELLDAVRAYLAQRELVIDLNLERKTAFLDLLRAAAGG